MYFVYDAVLIKIYFAMGLDLQYFKFSFVKLLEWSFSIKNGIKNEAEFFQGKDQDLGLP